MKNINIIVINRKEKDVMLASKEESFFMTLLVDI